MDLKHDSFVTVSARIKPVLCQNTSSSSCLQIISKQPPVLVVLEKPQPHHFDHIFTDENDQESVYKEAVGPLVEQVKAGYNSTVFAYGQTGTGKTYTMGTNPDIVADPEVGIVSRALDDLLNSTNEEMEVDVFISFIEIYNEKVFDLLNSVNVAPLPVKGFNVDGFIKKQVYNGYDARKFLKAGGMKRHTGETKQNANSSRSHAIFTIYCHVRTSETESVAKLNLVDLAGSESVRKTGNQGSRFQEGININKGLLSLGQVMMALSNNSSHVPYRQSIITTILKDSLDKRNFVSLIACVSSNSEDASETLQTLEFASRVKNVKMKPEINQMVSQYKNDNPVLFANCKTPLKRTGSTSNYETPFKKPRVPMNTIAESANSSLDSQRSFLMSSISTEPPNQNFSPVIKKYMEQMEASLYAKLEEVIKSTVQRPTRRSSRINKENCSTPSFPWDNIRNEVSKMVRTEFVQFTGKQSRATSSPIENDSLSGIGDDLEAKDSHQFFPPRKLFDEDSSCPSSPRVMDTEKTQFADEIFFKVPKPMKQKPKKIVSPTPQRRTSFRLQLKSVNPRISLENTGTRKSARLSLKINTPQNKTEKLEHFRVAQLKATGTTDSPISAQTKSVLRILNEGTIKDLQKLHTVGVKTAEMILFFRQLNGRFKNVSDLKKMPQWQNTKYERFRMQNFLRC